MRDREVDPAVVIEVGRCDRRRGIVRDWRAVSVEMTPPLIEADVASSGIASICNDDIGQAIAV